MHIEELDHPPAGWHPLTVMRKSRRKWDWVALMVDVEPDEMKHCHCHGPALLFVNPYEYKPMGCRRVQQCYLRVRGKHRNEDAAWEAMWQMIEGSLH